MGVGEDRTKRILEIGSIGASIFRQERKVTKVDEGVEKKKEKERNCLVSVWGLYQVALHTVIHTYGTEISMLL